jgi:hypothetical protein
VPVSPSGAGIADRGRLRIRLRGYPIGVKGAKLTVIVIGGRVIASPNGGFHPLMVREKIGQFRSFFPAQLTINVPMTMYRR